MPDYNIIAENDETTVVAKYEPTKTRDNHYQSEEELEKEFIRMLCDQGYEYLPIHTKDELIANLRHQLELLNNYTFSDKEWKQFFSSVLANSNDGVLEKTRKIQEDNIQVLVRDDGSSKNITLIDRQNIHNNRLQVINQYVVTKEEGAKYDNRYDVTVLVNGLPMVHIELKRRGVAIREAFNQINRYERDSFWAASGLFEYVQVFVISNGTNTKYYSNTTRLNSTKPKKNGQKQSKTSNSFEFTSYWADGENTPVTDLVDFTKLFFEKHTILSILTKYCIFTSENLLLVMRPYQIAATERIIRRITTSYNYKKYGTIDGGGYIWHTTGSGKTLTSFKTARQASQLPFIDKVLFVVDRKDLDYQTMKEYDRFEKGCANGNNSTSVLKKQLEDPNARIIITTIQKLANFIKKNKSHSVYQKHVVFIFDECHRSQFGDMHKAIKHSFKKYHLFGFTGTPIFAANANTNNTVDAATTEQLFGDALHKYTIIDAINDKNVLKFHVEYYSTMHAVDHMKDELVEDIARERAMMSAPRIASVTKYILDHFNQKTYRDSQAYSYNMLLNVSEVASGKKGEVDEVKQKQSLKGFNSIFAVSSVPMAKLYYTEFKRQMAEDPSKKLRIATIFSYAPNEADPQSGLLGEENSDDPSALDKPSRDFLEDAIKDYNEMFHTNYDTSADKFQNYYKDVSLRMKNKEIDLLIVVNMFLTGFDATTLNTLWVDKNLKTHGLIQAFSRTNRILNSVKTCGNIVCFRNLRKNVDDALALFGDKNAGGIVLLRKFMDYYLGYEDDNGKYVRGYKEMVEELQSTYPLDEPRIEGEDNIKGYIQLFGSILRMRNLLLSFDEFKGKEILEPRELQDYMGRYLDLKDSLIGDGEGRKADIIDDVVFEIELIQQIDVNIDYILMLVQKYHDSNCTDKDVYVTIEKAIQSTPELRSKKELIDEFIARMNATGDVIDTWHEYIAKKREEDLQKIIDDLRLKPEETRRFLVNAFRNGEIKTIGTDLDKLLPPVSLFGGKRAKVKHETVERFKEFFEKYYGLGNFYGLYQQR